MARWPLLFFLLLYLLFSAPACGSGDDDIFDPIDVGDVDVGDTDFVDADVDDPDAGPPDEPVVCEDPIGTAPEGQRCAISPGSSDKLLIRGTILAGDEIYENGGVLVDDQGQNRLIECVGCDCLDEALAADATILECPEGVISPGLINPHDHLTYAEGRPQPHGEERFDHRHDWRRGLRGHSEISTWPRTGGSREVVLYGELRMLFGGATSIAGSTAFVDASGLLRNLDNPFDTEGLQTIDVDYRTFPLGDGGFPALLDRGCDYPSIDSEDRVEDGIYLPHVSEGVDLEAQNELGCLAGESGRNLIRENTSIIHGIAVDARDVALIADRGANLVWSPRTNIDLYGNTAPVTLYKRFGVPISLGTDWSTSGSMNMLRELQCADYLNRMHFNDTFTDAELWKMATYNAAISMGAEHKLGLIYRDYVADITIFDGTGRYPYRAVIDAEIDDVTLVLRGGEPLYGDAELIEALVGPAEIDQCEMIDVCDRQRRACVELDTGHTLSEIKGEIHSASYPLFFCEEPEDEPTCVPFRPSEYDGIATPQDSSGDGIPDSMDNCPDYFNPIRPMDGGLQADINGTGLGDVCDPCPLSEDPDCTFVDFNDWSGDGHPNDEDNCPFHYNPDQLDTSGDGIGDACSPCPEHHISPESPCPATIYEIKTGEVFAGERVDLPDVLVTAALPGEGIFVQVHPDDDLYDGVEYSGLYVFLRNSPAVEQGNFPAPGDRIRLVGSVSNFFGQLQVANVSNVEIHSSGHPLPEPVVVDPVQVATGGDLQEAMEGILVAVEDVIVTDIDVPPGPGDSAPTNEFIVDQSLHINNFFYLVEPFPELGTELRSIAGVLRWANDNSKLEPRSEDDIIPAPPALDRLEPEMVFVEVGAPAQTALQVYLDRPAEEAMTIELSYEDETALLGPDSVTIDIGEISAPIELEALAVEDDPIGVEAVHDGIIATAQVQTYDEDTPRYLLDVDAERNVFFAGESFDLVVSLNVPAGSEGESAQLEILPEAQIAYTETLNFDPGQRVIAENIELGTDTGTFAAFVTFEDETTAFSFHVFDAQQTLVETFSNFETSGSSYWDGSFVGDAGFAWHYVEAREAPYGSDVPAIDGTSMTLRDETSTIFAEEISGGISHFSVEMTQAHTGLDTRQLELLINGESRGTSEVFGTHSDDHGQVYEFVVDDLEVAGDFHLELRSIGTSQITIDNLTWTTGYPIDPAELDLGETTLDEFVPSSIYLAPSDELEPALDLRLSGPALEETTVTLSVSDPDALEGPPEGEIVFAQGQTTAQIPLRGLDSRAAPIEVEASLGTETVTALVRVDDQPRQIALFEACRAVLPNQSISLVVELDEPASDLGFELPIEVESPELFDPAPPPTLEFGPGESSAELDLHFGAQLGSPTVTVDTGSDSATLNFEIVDLDFPVVEDFETLPSTGGSYVEESTFEGTQSIDWLFGGAKQISDAHSSAIDGPAMVFGNDDYPSFLRTQDMPGGIASFSVAMRKAYSGAGERQLELLINGELMASSEVFGDFSGEDDEVRYFEVDGIDISCVNSLQLRSVNSGNQITIDDLSWEPLAP